MFDQRLREENLNLVIVTPESEPDPELAADVHASFDDLISISYRWGSPEWLELRKAIMDKGGIKSYRVQPDPTDRGFDLIIETSSSGSRRKTSLAWSLVSSPLRSVTRPERADT